MLAGTKVEVVYDPFDLTEPVSVYSHQGVPAGTAKLLEISRHVHSKAVNALKDQEAGIQNPGTGIDYLRLLEDQHRNTMSAAPISFRHLATNNTATIVRPDTQSKETTP